MAALLLKLAVPAGLMVGAGPRAITLEICHGVGGEAFADPVTIPVKQADQDLSGKPGPDKPGSDKPGGECPYAALSMVSLAGADAVLLALAMVFIIALGFAPIRFALPQRAPFLRPPLRGPPALI
ncbi:DUF2946 family protein [Novosphingobium naphthalenivorans]|uniref:DUF2946 family protein n=1 Tax=Novosphingobium naphthalenivorans TaxID=273168 RepID=UPI0008316936|nr:DUF2946 family protein [Novosphingobium naphthalenivorans]